MSLTMKASIRMTERWLQGRSLPYTGEAATPIDVRTVECNYDASGGFPVLNLGLHKTSRATSH